MKKKLLLYAFMIISPFALSAQDWLDVTDIYVENPHFDNGSTTGWQWNSNAGSQKTGHGGMEFWYGWFDFNQTLQVPNGKYRLSMQGFYRMQDHNQAYSNYRNGEEVIDAYLYANSQRTPISSIYTFPLTTNYNGGCWQAGWNTYFTNNMEVGAYCFSQGAYQNQLEVKVTDGTLRIGVVAENYLQGNWTMFDNFKLEYSGEVKLVSNITLSPASLSMISGENILLQAIVSPSDALFQTVTWSSTNPSVATVDEKGNVKAIAAGSCLIKASAKDNSGVFATCSVTVEKREATSSSLVINELQAANVDMYVDPSFNYGSWVELYNPSDKAASVQGFYISDDPSDLTKYRLYAESNVIPAHGYLVLWFDHHSKYAPTQIDSKLDYDGGFLYISNSIGQLLASVAYPESISRTSFARTTDGGNQWGITAYPTPGRSNASSIFNTTRLEAPVVDKDACLFTSPFNVQVTIPTGATLRYTTDGTTPTEQRGEISDDGLFIIDATTTFRFRLFQEGYLPSQVITRSYIYKDKDYVLPIISVVTDPVNLYDDSLGIYVRGVNGRTGNGQSSPCNWNMDWERPVNIEYITPEGEMMLNQEADMEMCGGWSRAWTPHSFKIKANKVYEGLNYLPYQVFPDKAHLKHKTWQIRNGGNDTDSRIKDAALQEIVHSSGLDVDGQECQPVVHFINGQFMGMLNIREPNNKHFVEANYGLDDDEIDQFEMSPDSNYVQKCGTDESFSHWHELSADAANSATYEEICNMVDIDEYINYMAIELYLGGTDWPQNNIKGFKPRREGGKFRFVLFDLDGALATTNSFSIFEDKQYNHTFDLIYDTGERMTGEIKWVTIFLNMLQNEEFRKKFIDTYCLVAGSVFTPERCDSIIDKMATRTESTLSYEGKSPWWTANSLKSNLSGRQQSMINSLRSYYRMNLSDVEEQKVSLSANIPEARILLNDMQVPTNRFDGSLFAPVTLKAEAPAGFRFAGWASLNPTNAETVFAKGCEWSYYDQGSQDGIAWMNSINSSWNKGYAPLGYFTSDANNGRGYQTFLDYGESTSNKRPTYYFTRQFTLSHTPASDDVYILNYTVDDGMVVYVNGMEAARYLMPQGTISYNTFSSTYANGNPDSGNIQLPASLFKKGVNVIAIEVHNTDAGSSDIYFDAELTLVSSQSGASRNYLCYEKEYTLPATGNFDLIACYEPIPEEELLNKGATPVRINEISADNSMYVNPTYYKKNDWIELYNTTSSPVNVAGMFLTDNLESQEKYQIPASETVNTIIPPHGYLIVWADKLDPVMNIHTNFKLDAEGGYVMLTSEDKTWSDTLYYPPHADYMTVGLYPDGGSNIYVMNVPTFNATNRTSSYLTLVDVPEPPVTGVRHDMTESNNKLYAFYANGRLTIYGQASSYVTVDVYATTGQRMLHQYPINLTTGKNDVDLNALQAGIYAVRITDNFGKVYTLKIVVQ